MAQRASPSVTSRKQPTQTRASDLVAAVLDAAVQVLRAEGAARFTTARVAERAGVSVGSLYQYFPNKAAILFRLQNDEWRRTSELIATILGDRATPPAVRVRTLVHTFLRSECDEAQVRLALADAAPLYRDAPEADAARTGAAGVIRTFVDEALPAAADAERALAADLLRTTLSQVGSAFSAVERGEAAIDAYAEAMAEMFNAFLARRGMADPPPD